MADRSVVVRLAANVSGFTGPMGAAAASANGLNGALGKQGTAAATSATQVGKLQRATSTAGAGFSAMGLGAGVAGIAVGKLAMDSVHAASDLAESQNKVAVVFGESADEVRDFGETAADSFGMSENAALSAASGFGQFFDAAGMSEQASADMSVELVKLATDLASFNNIGTDEALEKLRSGLAGEAEPMRALGVFLSEAAVKAKAMELGLIGANGELSEGAKIQARYALIMEQTGKAQGDFARTADGVANKTRTMNAEFEDAKAKLGEGLIPALSELTSAATVAMDGLGPLIDGLGSLQTSLAKQGRNFVDLIPGVREARDAYDFWTETLGLAGDETDDSASSIKEQQRVMDSQTLSTYEARDASGKFAEKTAEAQEKVEQETQALEDLQDQYYDTMNAALGLSDATIGYEQALDDATTALAENERTLDINTQAGRDNRTALDNIASAALGVMDQMYATGASEAAVTTKNATMRNSLYNAARQFGMTEKEAHDYTDRVLGIPPKANTAANFYSGVAEHNINRYLAKLASLPKEVESNIKATYEFRYQGGTGGMGGPQSAFDGSVGRRFPLPGGKRAYPVTKGLHPVNAIDYGAPSGTPIYASFSGYLVNGNLGSRSYGKYFRLSGSGQRPILGAHLSAFARGPGTIAQGSLIGWTGATGNATGPHLHLENFDTGGILGHGGMARNLSGRPERILNPAQTESFDKLVSALAGGAADGKVGAVTNVYINGAILDEGKLLQALNKATRGGGELVASRIR